MGIQLSHTAPFPPDRYEGWKLGDADKLGPLKGVAKYIKPLGRLEVAARYALVGVALPFFLYTEKGQRELVNLLDRQRAWHVIGQDERFTLTDFRAPRFILRLLSYKDLLSFRAVSRASREIVDTARIEDRVIAGLSLGRAARGDEEVLCRAFFHLDAYRRPQPYLTIQDYLINLPRPVRRAYLDVLIDSLSKCPRKLLKIYLKHAPAETVVKVMQKNATYIYTYCEDETHSRRDMQEKAQRLARKLFKEETIARIAEELGENNRRPLYLAVLTYFATFHRQGMCMAKSFAFEHLPGINRQELAELLPLVPKIEKFWGSRDGIDCTL